MILPLDTIIFNKNCKNQTVRYCFRCVYYHRGTIISKPCGRIFKIITCQVRVQPWRIVLGCSLQGNDYPDDSQRPIGNAGIPSKQPKLCGKNRKGLSNMFLGEKNVLWSDFFWECSIIFMI